MTSSSLVDGRLNCEHWPAAACLARDGALYFTVNGIHNVIRSQPQDSRYSRAIGIAGGQANDQQPGGVDGDYWTARFHNPKGVCLNPLDGGRSLLVLDGSGKVRRIDTLTGATTTLSTKGAELTYAASCMSGSDPTTVWINDAVLGAVRLDMRSLELHAVSNEYGRVVCVDDDGCAVCCERQRPRLWRLTSDGSATLLADAPGRDDDDDGSAPEEEEEDAGLAPPFSNCASYAFSGDGLVVADYHTGCIRLISPEGVVSTLAEDACIHNSEVVVTPSGDVVVISLAPADAEASCFGLEAKHIPAGLAPPRHLAPVPHPTQVLNRGLLQSGLLADAAIRVVSRGGPQGRRQGGQQEAAAPGAATVDASASGSSGGAGLGGNTVMLRSCQAASAVACAEGEGGEQQQLLQQGSPTVVDIPCHRAILAGASPYFLARFAGPLAQQQQEGQQQGPGEQERGGGRKRKAPSGDAVDAPPEHAAAAAIPGPVAPAVVVTVDDASADAVRAVLRHVYTGDLGGVTAATAQEVLYLAQQWGLDGLLEASQRYVARRLLGPGNAAEWLICSHLRGYGVVRAAALRAVVRHFDAVRGDAAQKALLDAHPSLLWEVIEVCRRDGGSR